jgi:cytochrome c biogenesis protein CcmG, thiol:disulfide interchange protein DsbE
MTARQQGGVVLAIIVFVVVALVVGRRVVGSELEPVGTGVRAPAFSARTLDTPARVRTLADYRGQVILLNVWATWCAPCRAEMPSLEQLYQSYAARGFKVVAVSIDGVGMETGIRAYVKELGLTFDILHNPAGDIQETYQMTGVPESFLIGRDGVIRKKIAGAIDWNSESNRRLIARLLTQ